jgi:hypothetical protein
MYKLKNQYMVGQVVGQVIIRHNADGTISSFGQDPANTDYAEYLKWVAEGNSPLSAEGTAEGNEPLPPDSQE